MAAASVARDVTSYNMGLAAPLALFFLVFFVAPLVQLFILSLHNDSAATVWGIGQYAHFLTDKFSLSVLGSTLLLGAEVTALCLVLGFPIAWLYHRVGSRAQTVIILIVLLPLLTSVVVRTFAWIVILGRQGIVNSTLLSIGAIDTPWRLLYTQIGVVVALAQV
ncbi:MAG: ABC transporter permease, partial [Bradyrhizobium sp.]